MGTDTTLYTYDALGNLTQVRQPDGTRIGFLTDAQNRRIGQMVNDTLVRAWLYQGQLTPVAELDGQGQVVSRFVYATGVNVPDYLVRGDSTYRLIRDHLGSVQLVVNVASGAIAQQVTYDEFGIETANPTPGWQPFGYAGGLTDAQTGLVRFGARDYDPTAGRWTAKDPIGFAGGATSLYEYAANDPVNDVDPSGLSARSMTVNFAVSGAISLVYGTVTGALLATSAAAATPVIVAAAAGIAAGALIGYGIVSTLDALGELSAMIRSCENDSEQILDHLASLAGGVAGGGLAGRGFAIGWEFARVPGWRFAPFGNRTGHPFGELPHYHRPILHPNPKRAARGESAPNGSIDWHRPYEKGW